MTDLSSKAEEGHSLERISTDDFLEAQGVKGSGIAVLGDQILSLQNKARLKEEEEDGKARRAQELAQGESQRRQELADSNVRRVKDLMIHGVGLLLVIVFALGGGAIMLDDSSSSKDKEWARSLLSAIGGAVAGFVFGQGSKKT